jgi:hypothetical protein
VARKAVRDVISRGGGSIRTRRRHTAGWSNLRGDCKSVVFSEKTAPSSARDVRRANQNFGMRRHVIFDDPRGFQNLGTVRDAVCRVCGCEFCSFRAGRRGRFPTICSQECKRLDRRARRRTSGNRGRPRAGVGYRRTDGAWIASPVSEVERTFPTSHQSGRILRSHLVWNRAHPHDLVQPGEVIGHIDGDRTNDVVSNLWKGPSSAETGQVPSGTAATAAAVEPISVHGCCVSS